MLIKTKDMLPFTFGPVSFALQLNGDDCRVGKQQQDIHSVRARSAGATGRWRTVALPPYYPLMSDDALTVASPPAQAGQYTSIFVDNAAGASITIQNGSDFMGMLLGV